MRDQLNTSPMPHVWIVEDNAAFRRAATRALSSRSTFCGVRAFQNCMYQLWLTPTSQHRMASFGITAWQSATIRSGPDGTIMGKSPAHRHIGRTDRRWGEVPIAVAAVTDGPLVIEDLGEYLTERLARYKHPKALEIVDALPRNPAGKVLKTELRVRYGANRDSEKHAAPKDSVT